MQGVIEDREQTKNAVIEEVALPVCVKVGEMIDVAFPFDLKGTESLFFHPSGGNATLAISSSYPLQVSKELCCQATERLKRKDLLQPGACQVSTVRAITIWASNLWILQILTSNQCVQLNMECLLSFLSSLQACLLSF